MESEKKELPEKKPKYESEAFITFKESFENVREIEEKIGKTLEFMKAILADVEGGSFKDFWDAKKLIGPLFKERMNPVKRNHLWSEYTQIGDEARRIKEIKDEQSAFSIEQIELAIDGLEADIGHYDRLIEQIPYLEFPSGLKELSLNEGEYNIVQRELQLLKTLISRLDALRKEILSTDMRISHKNKILKRLSKLGDEVFPKRKELIKKLSGSFISDVESFVKDRFPEGDKKFGAPYYVIRDEIKSFQGLAKLLTLNTQAFTESRKALSECWDKIREKEKERRSEMGERSEEHKKNFEAFIPKVEAFETFCAKEENHIRTKVLEQSNTLQDEMKECVLNRHQVKDLKDRIQNARANALDHVEVKVEKKKHAAKKEINELKEKLIYLIENESSTSLEDLEKGEEELKKAYEKLNLTPLEIHFLERQFADLKSFILNKRESIISSDALEELYKERAAHLEVIKGQMEEYRREMGGSSLDFEKAMIYRELYDSAKIHFESEMEALENLEEKLI